MKLNATNCFEYASTATKPPTFNWMRKITAKDLQDTPMDVLEPVLGLAAYVGSQCTPELPVQCLHQY